MGGFRTTMGAPMLSTTRWSGRCASGATRSAPFDQRERDLVTAFAGQAAMAVEQREARAAARGARRRARPQGRRARGAARGRRGGDRPASTCPRCWRRSPNTRSGSPATDGGSIMEYDEDERRFLVRSVYRTEPERDRAAAGDPHPARRDTLVGRAAKLGPADGGARPEYVPSSIRICRCCTTPAGVRWSPYHCCGTGRSSASLVVRREATGGVLERDARRCWRCSPTSRRSRS